MLLKYCSKCDQTLPVTKFARCSTSSDGKQNYCKKCMKEYGRQYNLERTGKVCAMCGEKLPVANFSKNASSDDGLQSYCKECTAFYREHGYSRRNTLKKQKKSENSKKRCKACKQLLPFSEFDYYEDNPEKLQNYCRNCVKEAQKNRQMKTCFKCWQEKPIHEFYQSTLTEDGLFDICKDCCNTRGERAASVDYAHYTKYFSGAKI